MPLINQDILQVYDSKDGRTGRVRSGLAENLWSAHDVHIRCGTMDTPPEVVSKPSSAEDPATLPKDILKAGRFLSLLDIVEIGLRNCEMAEFVNKDNQSEPDTALHDRQQPFPQKTLKVVYDGFHQLLFIPNINPIASNPSVVLK